MVQPRVNSYASSDILVVGAGPAGCAAAIGLRRLGHRVTVLYNPHNWTACHGISARTLQGLRTAGLSHAASSVFPVSDRRVSWNGNESTANTEHLLSRPAFDAALLADVRDAGIRVQQGLMRSCREQADHGLLVGYRAGNGENHCFHCSFLVDARGRSGHGNGGEIKRGPGTLSLLQQRKALSAMPGSRVCSFEQGWAWVATLPSGETYVQLTVDAAAVQLPRRHDLDCWFDSQVSAIPSLRSICRDSEPTNGITARGSTSALQSCLVSGNTLRAGDAAMAVDPLSGNGIFQALSSALAAPAVINTIMRDPSHASLAREFYEERVRHSFLRFARTGRDFYRMESRWPDTPFWKDRQDWPDREMAHPETSPTLLGVESRPVVREGYIVSREVAVTSDQPLGVWHVGEIELAPLLRDLPVEQAARERLVQHRLRSACEGNTARAQLLTGWLRRYRIL